MEKLFNDSEVFMKERPVRITEQQAKEFYTKMAKEIIKNKYSTSSIEDIIEDLADISYGDNGYEIAKKLDDYISNASYNIDVMFCEWLDCFNSDKEDVLRENIKTWVKAHNIKPKYAKGQKLKIEKSIYYASVIGSEIYVTGHRDEEAYYMVDADKNRNGGICVNYEKLEANCSIV